MSASMCNKTVMSPEFLTRFLGEYRALPGLWQVPSTEYPNRGKRDELWYYGGTMSASMCNKTFMSPEFRRVPCIAGSVAGSQHRVS